MALYRLTEKGSQIAEDANTPNLAEAVLNADNNHRLILHIIGEELEPHYNILSSEELRRAEKQAVGRTTSLVGDNIDELLVISRGLGFDLDRKKWRYVDGQEHDTLFTVDKLRDYTPARYPDQFILSGVVGGLIRISQSGRRHPILDPGKFSEYGFSTHLDALAFAGAHVIGTILEQERVDTYKYEPSFSVNNGPLRSKIIVTGDMNGDFKIVEERSIRRGSVSPTGSYVEFSPENVLSVGGYHSIEPSIVAGLLEADFKVNGIESARELLSRFKQAITKASSYTAPVLAPFADYGDGMDPGLLLVGLNQLVSGGYSRPDSSRPLLTCGYLPNSDVLFEMLPTKKGIRFQNRHISSSGPECNAAIDIPRSHYADLFEALLKQATLKRGRTSPEQLIDIIDCADGILNPR